MPGRTDEAIILVGGLGTRLRGVISDVPKPLAPVCGRPFLAYVLDALSRQAIRRVVLATGYRGDQVEAAIGSSWDGMEIVYSREPEPLGTGGAIARAAGRIAGGSFFVLNGDTFVDLDYAAFATASAKQDAQLGMALAQVHDIARYGAVEISDGRVRGFVEKGREGPGYINAGVYWVDKALLETMPETARFSFETEVLVPYSCAAPVVAFTQTSRFIDIGVPEDYARVHSFFAPAEGDAT
jgi:D-glycero-alpha-D-manno-heptose 1-phosphate guanylyltransferase